MIQNYEIKYVNNKEILYIYLNFNNEFAKLKSKKNKLKLKKEIKKYIKKNKINFKGTTIAIIVGGIMIGTIMINKPKYNYKTLSNHTISLLTKNNIDNEKYIEEKETVEKNQKIEKEVINDIPIKETTNKVSTNETKENIKTNKEINTTNSNTKENSKEREEIKVNISENNEINSNGNSNDESIKESTDNNTYVTIYRQNGSVLTLELENYLIGVVGSEMPALFNTEALKAQAILARTYTIKAINTGKRLTDTTNTQVYKSESELKNTWGSNYTTYYNKIKNAVDSTKSLVLKYNGTLIEAVYHSTSNGKTENSSNVWKYSFPYLTSVESPYDTTNSSFSKTTFFSYEELSNKLNTIITQDTIFNISLNESGRVKTIEFNNIILSGVEFRTKLSLRSADFTLEKTNDGINITTKGYGHGVGMSQYGANGFANNGYNYEAILKHYYQGVSITKY